ncbi:nucleoside diphosphate-linked moiety X motif 19 [Trichomycterus rosablanca]|uniref:nucleoside diphosphate-linked moiety X motif 19 n=1 Tax=Trichomycterus rosablanca TaxID=2290929 RepID=UPI002F3506AB
MNTALKHWKEAATVILAAGMKHKRAVEALWRDTSGSRSALLQQHVHVPPKSAFDYEVLLLKRSSKSGFMPSAYVFPGGIVEPVDFSAEWLELFKAFRHLPNFGVSVVKQPIESRPPMFAADRVQFGSPIPGDIAFRICAVRETFEESGVLLVVPTDEAEHAKSRNQSDHQLTALSDRWDRSSISKWRSLVLQNSSNFIQMCKELECLPNIWALHEWGNWLTPDGVNSKQRRYDTAFYMCCLKEIPTTLQDQKEIVHFKWSSPSEILHSYQNREFWIAPPQFYDLGRMCNFPLLSDLHDFAKRRSTEGCEQWLPVILPATDGSITVLPGDSQYTNTIPDAGKTSSTAAPKKRLEQLQEDTEGSNMHRIAFQNLYNASVYVNIIPKYKHLAPLTSSDPNGLSKHNSKL